jgi:hypothetical protein
MKTHAVLKQLKPIAMPGVRFLDGLRDVVRSIDVNWYQVAVVAMATFAVSMDLMFPPVRVAIGHDVDIYAGHAGVPLSISGAVHVDFVVLAVEIAVIIAAALVGWRMGLASPEKRESVNRK